VYGCLNSHDFVFLRVEKVLHQPITLPNPYLVSVFDQKLAFFAGDLFFVSSLRSGRSSINFNKNKTIFGEHQGHILVVGGLYWDPLIAWYF